MIPLFERSRLDRRRVEVAHLHFAILQVASWYPEHMDLFTLPLHANLDDTLTKLVAKYHGVFMSCYASKILLGHIYTHQALHAQYIHVLLSSERPNIS